MSRAGRRNCLLGWPFGIMTDVGRALHAARQAAVELLLLPQQISDITFYGQDIFKQHRIFDDGHLHTAPLRHSRCSQNGMQAHALPTPSDARDPPPALAQARRTTDQPTFPEGVRAFDCLDSRKLAAVPGPPAAQLHRCAEGYGRSGDHLSIARTRVRRRM